MVYSAYGSCMLVLHSTCICDMMQYFNEKLWGSEAQQGGGKISRHLFALTVNFAKKSTNNLVNAYINKYNNFFLKRIIH